MAKSKSYSIKQRKRQPLPPITEAEVRERDVATQEAFEEHRKLAEVTAVAKQKWDKARRAFHSAMHRWTDQKNKT